MKFSKELRNLAAREASSVLRLFFRSSISKIGIWLILAGGTLLAVGDVILLWALGVLSAIFSAPPPDPAASANEVLVTILGAFVLLSGLAICFFAVWLIYRDEHGSGREVCRIIFKEDQSWFFWTQKDDWGDNHMQFVTGIEFEVETGSNPVTLISVNAWRFVDGCCCGRITASGASPWLTVEVPEGWYDHPPSGAASAGGGLMKVPLPQDGSGRLRMGYRMPEDQSLKFYYRIRMVPPNRTFWFYECNADAEVKVEIRTRRKGGDKDLLSTFYYKEDTLSVSKIDGIHQPPRMNDAQIAAAQRGGLLRIENIRRLKAIDPQDRYLHLKDSDGQRAKNRSLCEERNFVLKCWRKIESDEGVKTANMPFFAAR